MFKTPTTIKSSVSSLLSHTSSNNNNNYNNKTRVAIGSARDWFDAERRRCTLCQSKIPRTHDYDQHRGTMAHASTDFIFRSYAMCPTRTVASSSSRTSFLQKHQKMLQPCFDVCSKSFDAHRQRTLYHNLALLSGRGVLASLENPLLYANGDNTCATQMGYRALKSTVLRICFTLFPDASSGELSSFLQMILLADNCRTLYNILNLGEFIRNDPTPSGQDKAKQEKRYIVWSIAGDLFRFGCKANVMPQKNNSSTRNINDDDVWMQALARSTFFLFVAELTMCRLHEYGGLAEQAWRRLGCEVVPHPHAFDSPISKNGGGDTLREASEKYFDIF
eukprot:PhM_4_TR11815/c0_g1_i1/m.40178